MNKQEEIHFKIYNFSNIPIDFFNWCLENKLYKETTDKNFISRMKEMYELKLPFNGLTTVVAFIDNKAIGIIHCEHENSFKNAWLLKNVESRRPIVEKSFNWGFYNLGFISIFIKEQYRNQSIATQLWNLIEDIRLSSLKDIQNYDELSVPLFQAKELAFEIIKRKSTYSYVAEAGYYDFFKYNLVIHHLTSILLKNKDAKKVLRNREKFHPKKWMATLFSPEEIIHNIE